MSYSFEYIDIILLAMIAGFIFLRLRGILGKKTGFEGKIPPQFEKEFQKTNIAPKLVSENFDEVSQKEFLNCGEIFPSKPVFLPSIPLKRRNIKPAIIARRTISMYSKL